MTREEYEKLLREQQELREEIRAMKREREQEKAAGGATSSAPTNQPALPTTAPPPSTGAADGEIAKLRHDVDELQRLRPGFSNVVIAGDADFDFAALRHQPSTFSAAIAPLFLWRPAERLLVEAAFDIGISSSSPESSSTSFDLNIADVTYEVNDYLMVGGGLFVAPFGVFHNHFDPPWVDKLPDPPLAFGDGGITPESEVGVFARGALPAGSTKITYDVYLANGPQLSTTNGDTAGSLNFADFTDFNGNKAVGGRVGFLPLPELELGYSLQLSEPNPNGVKRAHATLQGFDVNYRPDAHPMAGVLDLRAEYVWSDVTRLTYDPTGAIGFGPTRFSNHREGAYVQLAYRPIYAHDAFVRKLEAVGRFDFLNTPLASPGGDHERRWTIGLDYWLAPNAVFKVAYEFDHRKQGENASGFLTQFGIGF